MQVKGDKSFSYRSSCPISTALDVIGDKWSLLILRDIVFMGKHTYSEFAASGEQMATNILAERLKKLLQFGLLEKAHPPGNKKTIHYSLTQKGKDLIPLMAEMVVWSTKYEQQNVDPKAMEFAEFFSANKDAVLARLYEGNFFADSPPEPS